MTEAAPPPHGPVGVLHTTPDAVQCHACGEWFATLAAHTYPAHGLRADDYRREFGLMAKTRLTAPNLRAQQSKRARDHLIEIGEPHRETIKHVPTEERRRRAKQAERRAEHELNATEPERTRPMLEARFGPEGRIADEVLREAVDVFVEELAIASRGVWVRTGERLGVGWSTARSRVHLAADRGLVQLDGIRTDLTATSADGARVVAPDSFEAMYATLLRFADHYGSSAVSRSVVFEGVQLGRWVESLKSRRRNRTLPDHQTHALESLPGWEWPEDGPYRGGSPVDGVIWTTEQGAFLRRGSFGRIWRRAVEESVGAPCRVHDLRHTHVAWLIAAGEHPRAIMTRLGHASITTTINTYGW